MEVLNRNDFDQKNVLIGQSGKTQGFGVTNDPALMGILSTGLYQNPMRTMIQEVMFNAWDAHRMGKCQDKPIDIYINETSGLIVRDYGPGINPEDMVPIYCIYGASTKRQDEELTGGFGLGSKSPYAYTDSFTVTSHYNNTKNMYVMNRVSEENGGGPGMSPIIEGVETSESGLMVTIPLKSESDQRRAYEYIKDLIYLSGIKANIHFEDEEKETIEAKTVQPGEWFMHDSHKGQIFAVYGGVRYQIYEDDAYQEEFHFVSKMAQMLGTIYIGFKSSSLTPLPSREGLNLNDRTVSNIKNMLEIIEENFRTMLLPVSRTVLKAGFKLLMTSSIEPKYLVQGWAKVSTSNSLREAVGNSPELMKEVMEQCPEDMNKPMWNSMCKLVFENTEKVERLLGTKKMNQMKYVIWAKNFPNHRHYKSYLLFIKNNLQKHVEIHTIEAPITSAELISAKKLCDEVTDQDNSLRYEKVPDNWLVLTNIRRAGGTTKGMNTFQKQIIQNLSEKPKTPNQEYPDTLWFKKDGTKFEKLLLTKQIIVAKTLGALKETKFNYQNMFAPAYKDVTEYHPFYRTNFGTKYHMDYEKPVAAIVIHQRKGNYDKAVKALRANGWTVHEAIEPKKQVRPKDTDGNTIPAAPRSKPTYPLYHPGANDMADWSNEVENPTCYVCITENKARYGYGSDLPNRTLLAWVAKNTPRFVIIHNKQRAKPLEKKGIPDFADKLHAMVEKIVSNEERMRKIRLYTVLREEIDLPDPLIMLPEVQKFFGLPYLRTKQKEAFEDELKILKIIQDTYRGQYSCIHASTIKLVKDTIVKTNNEDSVLAVRRIAKKAKLLNSNKMANYVSNLKPGELKIFSEKVMRFLRTV